MGFSPEWNDRYEDGSQLSVWPWSDVVSLVHRYCKHMPKTESTKVYELGCGAGANIPFFRSLGMMYHATDGSEAIVTALKQKYPDLRENIVVADFTATQPFHHKFDLIVDRASLTHNDTESIHRAMAIVFDSLNIGGIYIGSDWFSTRHSDFNNGEMTEDPFTRTAYSAGAFAGLGKVHFADETHLKTLFAKFEILLLEEKQSLRVYPHDHHRAASWNIVARKLLR